MKDINGKKLRLNDPVWFCLPYCSGSGIVIDFSPKKVTCHVLCADETFKGIYPKNVIFWKDKKEKH